MSTTTTCPSCGTLLARPEGRMAKCMQCGATFVVLGVPIEDAAPRRQPEPASDRAAAQTLRPELAPAVDCAGAETLRPEPDVRPDPRAALETRQNAPVEIFGVQGADAKASAFTSLDKIGRFVLQAALGQGAFGRVYRAYDPQLDRQVALKVPKFGADQPIRIERFLREAQAAARLRHPNLVAVYETGQAGQDCYIASEYVEGMPLSVRLTEHPPRLRQAVMWVRDLARALHYAHQEGIIHRDIKPANIMIGPKGRPQLMDFGLAKRLDEDGLPQVPGSSRNDAGLTAEGSVVGTPAYMAPEQARGDVRAVGPHSDQYSLGAVLYEMLTGRRLYDGSPRVVLAKVASPAVQPTAPSLLNKEVPPDLEAVCLTALAKEPSRRYADAGAFADDLNAWLRGQETEAAPISRFERLRRWYRRSPALALAAVLAAFGLVVACGLGVALALYQRSVAERRAQDDARLTLLEREQLAERTQALRTTCRLNHKDGLLQCQQQEVGVGVLLLAKAYQGAIELADDELQQEIGPDLRKWAGMLPTPPGVSSAHREAWDAAAGRWLRLAGTEMKGPPQPLPTARFLGLSLPFPDGADSARFRPDGQTVLAWGPGALKLWDLTSNKATPIPVPKQVQRGPTSWYDRYGTKALVRDREAGPLQLRDAVSGAPLGASFSSNQSGGLSLSPDGRFVAASAGGSGESPLRDAVSGKFFEPCYDKDWRQARRVFSPDGTRALTVAERRGNDRDEHLAQLWDLEAQKTLGAPFLIRQHDLQDFDVLVLGPDNQTAFIATHFRGSSGQIGRLWDVSRGPNSRPIGTKITAQRGGFTGAAFSPEGKVLLTCTSTQAQRWAVESQATIGGPQVHGDLKGTFFCPDGKAFVTYGGSTVRLWDAASGLPVDAPLNSEEPIRDATVSPDGRHLAAILAKEVRVWPIRPPATERLEAISLWAQLLSGQELRERGTTTLGPAYWQERRARYERFIGIDAR